MENKNVLEVKDLKVYFDTEDGVIKAVDGISFEVKKGKTLGLVGESGCGKSLTSKTIIGIEPKTSKATGEIIYHDSKEKTSTNLVALKKNGPEIRAVRGGKISMIFQEPMTAFSPLYTIGNQIVENVLLHRTKDKVEAKKIAIEMMKKVGIANAEKRYDQYPMEFSGGMRQRAMIAMAMSCEPELLIADEPTTALDVTIQAQVLQLMKNLQRDMDMGILFITHDLGVVAEMCDEIVVMYLGKAVERGSAKDIFKDPKHPYTKGLLRSIPVLGDRSKSRLESIEGTVPIPINLPDRCGFYDRCEHAIKGKCDVKPVSITKLSESHQVRCFLYEKED
ncbi:ABC transporter ATP-binding protein [Acidaminobacter sp. JC074]|uniref:ABC transporter ATP-binding protein n=1 Tax=Acidaminobacter sp. JC074 TaxID=2530199 RepID=UPI001F0F80BB|nr:ABC transporter ATP-binding protein [Acidaminobacter sp. JC074]MCH4887006.1 ABC transporter ATP-binding protein [Acidaminobacter sp. JC074]